eukprot:12994321-Alexandrium_andersonii.AAC.1
MFLARLRPRPRPAGRRPPTRFQQRGPFRTVAVFFSDLRVFEHEPVLAGRVPLARCLSQPVNQICQR